MKIEHNGLVRGNNITQTIRIHYAMYPMHIIYGVVISPAASSAK